MQCIEVYELMPIGCDSLADDSIVLDHEQRAKSRLKVISEAGREVRVILDRDKSLAIGNILHSRCELFIEIRGAQEEVAVAKAADWLSFSRACYHLGNRHVRLQLGEQWLCFKPDHVLEQMLMTLGLIVEHTQRVFEPEQGAYALGHHEH